MILNRSNSAIALRYCDIVGQSSSNLKLMHTKLIKLFRVASSRRLSNSVIQKNGIDIIINFILEKTV